MALVKEEKKKVFASGNQSFSGVRTENDIRRRLQTVSIVTEELKERSRIYTVERIVLHFPDDDVAAVVFSNRSSCRI